MGIQEERKSLNFVRGKISLMCRRYLAVKWRERLIFISAAHLVHSNEYFQNDILNNFRTIIYIIVLYYKRE